MVVFTLNACAHVCLCLTCGESRERRYDLRTERRLESVLERLEELTAISVVGHVHQHLLCETDARSQGRMEDEALLRTQQKNAVGNRREE